jgi:transposase
MFGLSKRRGNVYAKVVSDTESETLMRLIARKIASESVDFTGCNRSLSDFYHERINLSALFANGKNHINGVDHFWNKAKRAKKNIMVCLTNCPTIAQRM